MGNSRQLSRGPTLRRPLVSRVTKPCAQKEAGPAGPAIRAVQSTQIVDATRALLERLLQRAPDAAGIVMCGQLHGMVLADERGNAAIGLNFYIH